VKGRYHYLSGTFLVKKLINSHHRLRLNLGHALHCQAIQFSPFESNKSNLL
jgi:hypothetical protein